MPRQPDPDLEERILNAAHRLWKRGGEKSLTMRAVAKAAGTNTPAVYRRFKDRRDLIRGLLRSISARIRKDFEAGNSVEEMAEAYIESAVKLPHEYELFYSHVHHLSPPKGPGKPRPIGNRGQTLPSCNSAWQSAWAVRRRTIPRSRWRCGRPCTERPNCCSRNRFPKGMRKSCVPPAGRR